MNPVIIGTIIWIILGLAVGWKIMNYVAEKSPLGKEWENQKYYFYYLELLSLPLFSDGSKCGLYGHAATCIKCIP